MNDELILSDGILWDVNSAKEIHKFDKLNQTLNGVFHPNGTEVVSNTEVWDLRTFHLLKTVPALDQMNVIFSPVNNIIYAVSLDQENEDESHYVTSFKTLDALDYSNICKSYIDITAIFHVFLINIFYIRLIIKTWLFNNCIQMILCLNSHIRCEERHLRPRMQQV